MDWLFLSGLKDLLDSEEKIRVEWYKRMWLVRGRDRGREKAGLIQTTEKEHFIAECGVCPSEKFCCNLKNQTNLSVCGLVDPDFTRIVDTIIYCVPFFSNEENFCTFLLCALETSSHFSNAKK